MSFLTIDREKCTRDGICAKDCPMGIITMNGDYPKSTTNTENLCLNCGHCVAVCPHGALSLHTMPVEDCQPLQDSWRIPPEQMEQLLKGRRSIRRYKKQPAQREVLHSILDMARFAPSGKNSQPVHWIVIQTSEHVREIAELVIQWMRVQAEEETVLAKVLGMNNLVKAWEHGYDAICRHAPHLIVAHAPKANKAALVDATIALSYAELAAISFGLGSCWGGFFYIASTRSPEIQNALKMPENHQIQGALMLGYPQIEYQRIPLRNEAQISWN